jgi:hypothetical protein
MPYYHTQEALLGTLATPALLKTQRQGNPQEVSPHQLQWQHVQVAWQCMTTDAEEFEVLQSF